MRRSPAECAEPSFPFPELVASLFQGFLPPSSQGEAGIKKTVHGICWMHVAEVSA